MRIAGDVTRAHPPTPANHSSVNRAKRQLTLLLFDYLVSSPVSTPLRRLEGISYWVIEDPTAIRDFINTEVRKEWELDVRSLPGDPAGGDWLPTLSRRKWSLEVLPIRQIKLNDSIMNFADAEGEYNFADRLAERRRQLRHAMEAYGRVIWPIIIRKEDGEVLDGYCRFTTLREMRVSRIYAYVGVLSQ